MTTNPNPTLALKCLGYTDREATFLYLVAVHSGYFLRRQFEHFIQRRRGYLSHHFTEKARIAGHIEVIDYQGRFVYHLRFKPIYRLAGNPDSQNQRRKGDAQIRARLMALDYVLQNIQDHYFETSLEKLQFFIKIRGASPSLVTDSDQHLHLLLGACPVSIEDPTQPASSIVRFAFIDEGLLSTSKFSRFLTELAPLLDVVGRFELIYAATSDFSFVDAEKLFRRVFSSRLADRQQTFAEFASTTKPTRRITRVPMHAKFTRLLLRNSYPGLLRNEPWRSVNDSDRRSQPQGVSA
jgi:hypothetical protein